MSDVFREDGNIKEIIEMLPILDGWANPGSVRSELIKSWIITKANIDLRKSLTELSLMIKQASDSSNKLWDKIFILNILLGMISFIWVIYTILTFYK
jgi:hypothetical protein